MPTAHFRLTLDIDISGREPGDPQFVKLADLIAFECAGEAEGFTGRGVRVEAKAWTAEPYKPVPEDAADELIVPWLVKAPGVRLTVNGPQQAEIVAKPYRAQFGEDAVTVAPVQED